MENIITTMDLGSNSFRTLKFDTKNLKSLGEYEKVVGTADGLANTGNISEEALRRVVTAIKESINLLEFDPIKTIAVTTQAMRVAKNNAYILEQIEKQTGVKFNIIEGHKEAELTLLAMQYALKREKLASDRFILLDIGGGSSELIIFDNGEKKIKSFSFGIVTLTQSKNKSSDMQDFEEQILEFISSLDLKDFSFVSTAGTPTTIAAVKHGLDHDDYDKHIVNGTKLYFEDLVSLQKEFQSLSKDDLIIKVGAGRDEYIDMGVEIFKLFYKTLNKTHSIVFDDGLREGVAIEYCVANRN